MTIAPIATAGLKAPPDTRADGVGADQHREADRQAVERVALGAARGRDVEHDPGEREREQELDEQRLADARTPSAVASASSRGRSRRAPRRPRRATWAIQ